MPWAGASVSLTGVLVISVATIVMGRFDRTDDVTTGGAALGLVPSGLLLASILLVVAALVGVVPLLLRRLPQLRSPLSFGTAGQLRRFLDWFLAGLTACALAALVGVMGLIDSWGIPFTGALFFGLGALLISMGIGYPRGGPGYDGPLPFVATVTNEFARFAPVQKYGTSILGLALITVGAWVPAPVLITVTTVGAAALWLLPWIIALVRTSRIERENHT